MPVRLRLRHAPPRLETRHAARTKAGCCGGWRRSSRDGRGGPTSPASPVWKHRHFEEPDMAERKRKPAEEPHVRLGRALGEHMSDDFAAFGADLIAKLREDKPVEYMKLMTSIL